MLIIVLFLFFLCTWSVVHHDLIKWHTFNANVTDSYVILIILRLFMRFSYKVYSNEPARAKIWRDVKLLFVVCSLLHFKYTWFIFVLIWRISNFNLNTARGIFMRNILEVFWIENFENQLCDDGCTLKLIWWVSITDRDFISQPFISIRGVTRPRTPELIMALSIDCSVHRLVIVFRWWLDWN